MRQGLAIVGHGKMGHLIEELAPEYGFDVRLALNSGTNACGAGLTTENLRGVDAAVEFSTPSAAVQNIRQLAALGIPVVAGTTGWFQDLACVREAVQSGGGALVWSPNFSVGVYRFRQVIAQAARAFATEHDYQAWGWEIHHAMKRDTPSGTLLAVAEEMKQAGFERAINLSANRAGAHPGERTRSVSIRVPTPSPFDTRPEAAKDLHAALCARRAGLSEKTECSNFARS